MLKKSMILIAALAGLALAAAPREPETTVTEAPAPSELSLIHISFAIAHSFIAWATSPAIAASSGARSRTVFNSFS